MRVHMGDAPVDEMGPSHLTGGVPYVSTSLFRLFEHRTQQSHAAPVSLADPPPPTPYNLHPPPHRKEILRVSTDIHSVHLLHSSIHPAVVDSVVMAERYIPEHRRTQFKAKNTFKPEELRRRREEQQVEIRKAKREENLAKRRGITNGDAASRPGASLGAEPDSDDDTAPTESQVCYCSSTSASKMAHSRHNPRAASAMPCAVFRTVVGQGRKEICSHISFHLICWLVGQYPVNALASSCLEPHPAAALADGIPSI